MTIEDLKEYCRQFKSDIPLKKLIIVDKLRSKSIKEGLKIGLKDLVDLVTEVQYEK